MPKHPVLIAVALVLPGVPYIPAVQAADWECP